VNSRRRYLRMENGEREKNERVREREREKE